MGYLIEDVDLIENSSLLEKFENLDAGMVVASSLVDPSSSLAPPPPLLNCLVIPQPGGRWGHMGEADRSTESAPDGLHDATLEGLDSGLADDDGAREPLVSFRPSRIRAVRPPMPSDRQSEIRHAQPPATAGTLSVSQSWMTSICLVLAMFAGAASAALIFHERLAAVVVQWEGEPR